jgi:hypothetical protein
MAGIYNYIIVIIKYDVGHCGSNLIFICGASFGLIIEIIRDKVERGKVIRQGHACLAQLEQKMGRQELRHPVASEQAVCLASLADTGENYSQRISGTECSGFVFLHCLCNVSDCGLTRGQFV